MPVDETSQDLFQDRDSSYDVSAFLYQFVTAFCAFLHQHVKVCFSEYNKCPVNM